MAQDELCVEEWRDVVGYDGLYQVSSLGRVRSLGRSFVNRAGKISACKPKVLSVKTDGRRRPSVTLCDERGRVTRNVDKLVCEAFMPNQGTGRVIYHLNGNLCDCRRSNLTLVDDEDLIKMHEERVRECDEPDFWRPVVGYEGLYEVSRDGDVRSLDRIVRNNTIVMGRNCTTSVGKLGYKVVSLSKDGTTKVCYVHRLVAEAFIPNDSNLEEVDHINGIKHDSRVDNLRWCSKSQNYRYAVELGLIDIKSKVDILTSEHVRARQRAACSRSVVRDDGVVFDSITDAAKSINSSKNSVWRVLNGVRNSIHGHTFSYVTS